MALFQSYAKPGVYTQVIIQASGTPLFGNARIPVLIGEGLTYFTYSNQEIIRGSSAVADNQVVDEDLSDQVTGLTNRFQLTYFPVTDGSGKGVVTNDPSKITVTSEGLPLTVISLTGATGQFITQEIIPSGNNLQVSYFFKKTDTLIKNEDESAQIPTSASFAYTPSVGHTLTFGVTVPGAVGNEISIAFTLSATGKSDALAVSGAGTNAISIELKKSDNISVRTLADIATLIAAGIPTSAAGYLTGTSSDSTAGIAQVATNFTGGAGPNSNTQFKTHFVPIVDGTNGGVVTTDPTKVTALVNGLAATVSAVDGQHGLVTLAAGVPSGSTLTLTYYTNQYQYTADLLPAAQVASIVQVGLGPNRSDFVEGVDFQLSQDGTQIEWGANADVAVGTTDPSSTLVFGPAEITTTLVDQQVWLRPVTGVVNGINQNFTLQDVPVDGSGLNRPTDNPALVKVYVGTDPVAALLAGAVPVARVSGASATIELYNPPATGNVYASYWRSELNDHTFTLAVVNANIPGQGSYSVTNELSQIVPSTTVGTAHVYDNTFDGIVWPNNFTDLNAAAGDAQETVTLTFQDDNLSKIITPAVNATLVAFTLPNQVTFTATEIGAVDQDFTAPNGTTNITFVSNAAEGIKAAGSYGSSPVYNSAQFFSGASGLLFTATAAKWQASTLYAVGDAIYDPATLSIQVVSTGGTSGGSLPTFSATPGTNSTPTPDGTVVWKSNGLAPTTVESIAVNIVDETSATLTLTQVAALFSGTNKVFTPKAGQITAVVSGSGATLATSAAAANFTGGVNPVERAYANRFLVTSSIAAAKGTGAATTPASANVAASAPWAANATFNGGQIVSFTVGGNQYLAQASAYGATGSTTPFTNASIITGATTVDNEITWITLGPVIVPVGTAGYLGETYIDAATAVKFTIVDPAEALLYGYTILPTQYYFTPGDTLTFVIAPSTTSPFITGSTPIINIGGLRTKVTTTLGASVGDTATIATFKGDANEPNVGEYYYVTFTVNKTSQDMALQLFTNPTDAYAQYGQPNVVNRLSLGVQLLTGNGAQQFGCVQVAQQPGQNVASDASYEAAIQSLSMALPGTDRKVNVIVPLSTSEAVQQYLGRFLTTQAAPRQKGEAIGFIGMGLYNTPADASALANSIANARVILVAPFAFGIQITNPTTGVAQEYAVSGEFAAAALAGLNCNPANDVATSLTNQNVVGFSRILQRLDDPTMDLMAANGVTLLVEQNGGLNVRHYKSTDPSNVITSEPTCTTISDYISQAMRQDLKQFIGRKFLGSLLGSIQIVANARMKTSVDQALIQGFSAPVVQADPNDPTTCRVSVTYQPVFALLYIGVTFTITSSSVSSSGASSGSASGAGNIGS